MELINRRIIEKYLKKKKGNTKLAKEINKLIESFEKANWVSIKEIKENRPDADRVHPDGYYFFDISNDRTMILVEIEDNQATIIWCGNHQEYESTFKNNKKTIKKWLQSNDYI